MQFTKLNHNVEEKHREQVCYCCANPVEIITEPTGEKVRFHLFVIHVTIPMLKVDKRGDKPRDYVDQSHHNVWSEEPNEHYEISEHLFFFESQLEVFFTAPRLIRDVFSKYDCGHEDIELGGHKDKWQ